MEEQQHRHIKEVYMDSALKPLASDPGNESISNCSFKSAYTQNTQTQRINEMITKAVKAKTNNDNAEFFELSSGGDMDQLDLEEVASSDGQVNMRNYMHIFDYQASIRNIENDFRLKEMENERRTQNINENNKMMLKAELQRIQGGSARQNMQQQDIIDDLINQFARVPPPYSFSDKRPKPLFPVVEDSVLIQHLRAVEMSQQSRQQPAPHSSNNPEPAHEPKGTVGRPRKDHGVPTETRTDPLWWNAQPVGSAG